MNKAREKSKIHKTLTKKIKQKTKTIKMKEQVRRSERLSKNKEVTGKAGQKAVKKTGRKIKVQNEWEKKFTEFYEYAKEQDNVICETFKTDKVVDYLESQGMDKTEQLGIFYKTFMIVMDADRIQTQEYTDKFDELAYELYGCKNRWNEEWPDKWKNIVQLQSIRDIVDFKYLK